MKKPKSHCIISESDDFLKAKYMSQKPVEVKPLPKPLPKPVVQPVKPKNPVKGAPIAVPAPKPVEQKPPYPTREEFMELSGDIRRLAAVLGDMFGEPFASHAKEIFTKRQGGVS